MIPFQNVPANTRVPLFYAEVNNSQANTSAYNQRALIIGQITGTGTATANIPVISAGPGDGTVKGGVGSMLDLMGAGYASADSFGEVWFLPLADAGGAVAATGTIAFAGTTTAAGAYSLYVAGVLVTVAVASGATAASIAAALAAAITGSNVGIPVTATAAGSTLTLTAKNAGLAGNDIDIRFNYQGAKAGEALPPGVTPTITAMSGGATNPTLTTALGNLANMPFDFIITPYTDPTTIAAIEAFLNDTTGRWSSISQVYGHAFGAYRGTFGAANTFGAGNNNQHVSFLPFYDSPSPNWVWAAVWGAANAVSLREDPGQPVKGQAMPGVLAPPLQSRFSEPQQNTFLYDGLSTFDVDVSGAVSCQQTITTYQTNAYGQPDNSYLKVQTLFLAMACLRALSSAVTSTFGRMKLAANGYPLRPGSNITTPNQIRAFLISSYYKLQNLGWVQNADFFAANVVVEQNATNPNRVDVLWPGVFIDQLDVFALLMQFRLIAPTGGAAGTASAALI